MFISLCSYPYEKSKKKIAPVKSKKKKINFGKLKHYANMLEFDRLGMGQIWFSFKCLGKYTNILKN